MKDNQPIDTIEVSRFIARSLMYQAAGTSSRIIDSFTSWLLAGVGACMALVIANLDKLSSYLALTSIRVAGVLFLVGAALAVIEKFISAFVVGAAEASAKSAEYAAEMATKVDEIDMNAIREEFREVTLPLTRLLKGVTSRLLPTKHGAHSAAKMSQIQHHFALASILFLLSTIVCLAYGLQV